MEIDAWHVGEGAVRVERDGAVARIGEQAGLERLAVWLDVVGEHAPGRARADPRRREVEGEIGTAVAALVDFCSEHVRAGDQQTRVDRVGEERALELAGQGGRGELAGIRLGGEVGADNLCPVQVDRGAIIVLQRD